VLTEAPKAMIVYLSILPAELTDALKTLLSSMYVTEPAFLDSLLSLTQVIKVLGEFIPVAFAASLLNIKSLVT
jgi:hypothetical protein